MHIAVYLHLLHMFYATYVLIAEYLYLLIAKYLCVDCFVSLLY